MAKKIITGVEIQHQRELEKIHRQMLVQQKENEKNDQHPNGDGFLVLENINKIYPNHVQAVYNFNLSVKPQEFIVFVGPSGCGKSTTLRMICGLESVTYGSIFINGIYANNLAPKDRNVSIVFQNYALFPHMTVYENIAYGLKLRKLGLPKYDHDGKQIIGIDHEYIHRLKKEKQYWLHSKQKDAKTHIKEIEEDISALNNQQVSLTTIRHYNAEEVKTKVMKAAQILNLTELLNRKPGELSGGQCQRVALGRVIVSDAKLLLMDEPLSNLDAKLRVQMRSEILKLHHTLKATTVYVTHDQTEAMTMASRIVVMRKGYIQQIGTPKEIYHHPKSLFVATFIGSPAMNTLPGDLNGETMTAGDQILNLTSLEKEKIRAFYKLEKQRLESVLLTDADNEIVHQHLEKINASILDKHYNLIIGIRPEDMFKDQMTRIDGRPSASYSATIHLLELLGSEYYAHIELAKKEMIAKFEADTNLEIDQPTNIIFDLNRIHVFDPLSEACIF